MRRVPAPDRRVDIKEMSLREFVVKQAEWRAAGNGKIRCALLILGCTGEIKNPAAYERLKEQFFAELLWRTG